MVEGFSCINYSAFEKWELCDPFVLSFSVSLYATCVVYTVCLFVCLLYLFLCHLISDIPGHISQS